MRVSLMSRGWFYSWLTSFSGLRFPVCATVQVYTGRIVARNQLPTTLIRTKGKKNARNQGINWERRFAESGFSGGWSQPTLRPWTRTFPLSRGFRLTSIGTLGDGRQNQPPDRWSFGFSNTAFNPGTAESTTLLIWRLVQPPNAVRMARGESAGYFVGMRTRRQLF